MVRADGSGLGLEGWRGASGGKRLSGQVSPGFTRYVGCVSLEIEARS